MDISQIDSNFRIETGLDKTDIKFYDVKNPPFEIDGVFYESGAFRRMPESVAKATNKGVADLHTNTAGGRIRFITDSPYVAISAKISSPGKMSHMAFTGSIGFDLYVKINGEDVFVNTYTPPTDIIDKYEGIIEFGTAEEREITVNMPLYSNVNELYVGLSENAAVMPAKPYGVKKPVVYYGSSITQGGCASRPGMSYQAMISRALSCDYINLGFSGSARGEDTVARYIAGMDMSLFVYDYDHNAPSAEHLKKTHGRMFGIIREKNPTLPIILLSRPKFQLSEAEEQRFDIIKQTYDDAVRGGDKNVRLLSGRELMRLAKRDGTVDNCHPNDFGFASMAAALIPVIKEMLPDV